MERIILSLPIRIKVRFSVLVAVMVVLGSLQDISAQETRETYTLNVRGESLSEVILQIVDKTGISIAYDAKVVEGKWVNCSIENSNIQSLLSCVLSNSSLDYYQLSSGTFVINRSSEINIPVGSITGTITESESGQPISGAHVRLYGTGLGTVTNDAGRFIISDLLPGEYSVGFSHISYEYGTSNIQVRPGELTVLRQSIDKETVVFEPIVIDGLSQRLTASSLGTIDQSLLETNISINEFESSLSRSNAPVSMDPATSNIHIESGSSGDHVFKLDGIPVFLPSSLSPFVGPFSGIALKSIQINRSGFGVSAGSQIAGTIEVLQRDPDAFEGSFQADPFSLQGALGSNAIKIGGSRLSIIGSARSNASRFLPLDPGKSVVEQYGQSDPFLLLSSFNSGISSNLSRTYELAEQEAARLRNHKYSDLHLNARLFLPGLKSLSLTAYRGDSDFENESNMNSPDDNVIGPAVPSFSIRNKYNWDSGAFGLKYEAVAGNRSLFNLGLRHSFNKHTRAYDVADEISLNLLQPGKQIVSLSTDAVRDDFHIKETALDLKFDYHRGNHAIGSGVSAVYNDHVLEFHFNQLGAAPVQDFYSLDNIEFESELNEATNRSHTFRVESFLDDRIQLTPSSELEGGIRLTYLPNLGDVYAEPRIAFRADLDLPSAHVLSSRTATGLYRQFVNQFDVSVFDAGSSLPTFRVWIPTDENHRPPLSVHLSQDLELKLAPQRSLSFTGYFKHQPHVLIVDYEETIALEEITLAGAKSRLAGLGLTWKDKLAQLSYSASYFYNYSQRQSDAVFGGNAHPLPWAEPHSLRIWASYAPTSRVSIGLQSQAVWNRSWKYRRAYYDYLSWQPGNLIESLGLDFQDPGSDSLPTLFNIDAFAAYERKLGLAKVQMKLEVYNLLNRNNVFFSRAELDGDHIRELPIRLNSITPAGAIKITF